MDYFFPVALPLANKELALFACVYNLCDVLNEFKVSLLNHVDGVGQILTLVTWVAWVHESFSVGGVGLNFGVGRVGLRCFVKKVLVKVSQNLQESTCAGVSC